jgi:hypothetical protein
VIVGPDGDTEEWNVPIRLLKTHSAFFKAAIESDFREKRERCIRLSDDEPIAHDLFITWAYTGGFLAADPPRQGIAEDRDVADLEMLDVPAHKAWVFGDKIRSVDFKNYSMRVIFAKHKFGFGTKGDGSVLCFLEPAQV